jgi:intein/homing endonuclease
VRLQVIIGQHYKDKLLLNKLVSILGCGKVYERKNSNTVVIVFSNFDEIYNKIIPLFNEYKIKGNKALDYKDFSLAAEIVNKKKSFNKRRSKRIKKNKIWNEYRTEIEVLAYKFYYNS